MDEVLTWFKARGLLCAVPPNISGYLTVEPVVRVFGSTSIVDSSIGAFSYLAPNTSVNYCSIGRYCSIGDRCTLGPSQHPTSWLTTSPITYKDVFEIDFSPYEAHEYKELKPVSIGNDVWIGAASAVMGGVTIGDGAIVAYGSIVTRDVPPYAIVGGTPARLIRMRFPSQVAAQLITAEWWNFDVTKVTPGSIHWEDPVTALKDLEREVCRERIQRIPARRHRFSRNSPTQFGFETIAGS